LIIIHLGKFHQIKSHKCTYVAVGIKFAIMFMLRQVSNVLNTHGAELMEKRYRFNIGLLMCEFFIISLYIFLV